MDSTLDDLLGQHRAEQAIPEDHPDFGTLTAFALGKLDEADQPAVFDHMMLCRNCADLVLALRREQSDEPEPETLANDHAWARFQRRLDTPIEADDQGSVTAMDRDGTDRHSSRPWKHLSFAYSLAAVFLLAFLLGRVVPTSQEYVLRGARTVVLEPSEEIFGTRGTNAPTDTPADSAWSVTTKPGPQQLILIPSRHILEDTILLVMETPSGKLISETGRLGSDGVLHFDFDPRERGTYRFQSFELDGEDRIPLDNHEVVVE